MINDSIDNLRIDLNRRKVQQTISVRTGDTKTRTIHVSIVNNGLLYKLDQILFAEILIKKVDGTETDQGMVISGDELHYTFRTQDLATVGENKCQVKLTGKDGSIVTTPEFCLYVYTNVVDQYKQESMNEYTAITMQLVEVNRLAGEVASNTIIASEASASASQSAEMTLELKESVDESIEQISNYASEAMEAAAIAATKAADAEDSASAASQSAQFASDTLDAVNLVKNDIDTINANISEFVETAIEAKNIAASFAESALSSETHAREYCENASISAEIALSSKNTAAISEQSAANSASTATEKAGQAQISAENAANSEENAELAKSAAETAKAAALLAESNAHDYAANAIEASDSAETYYSQIEGKYNDAKKYADLSQSYAVGTENVVRDNDSVDNAKSYYEKAKQISEGLGGGLIPMGTLVFEDLPDLSEVTSGWMYNVSNDFTSDVRFKDGAGLFYIAGTNVYKTADGYWDCTAGSTARMNSSLNTVTFNEAGIRENIETGESHATLFGKIKKFFADLHAVAFSGSYSDLSNKPDIPSKVSELSNDSGYAVASSLAEVATSGSYNDLSGKPTIPSAVTESTVTGWGFTKNTGTYNKPSGGIPKTDLASDVQTSLRKADTALQSVSKSDIGLENVGNFKAVSTASSQGLSDTEKANARANIGAGTSSFSGSYNDLSNKPTIPLEVTSSTVSGWGFKKFIEVTGSLAANATSLVLSNSAITTSSTVEVFTSAFGVSPTEVSVAAGNVTLTFEKQTSSVNVKVRIS